ncbi:g8085 [Coccomyxa viridis]|uniref:G8085 protein n=1 Tax=Coccomyxa viridis TaxID=1274662 RepID=A0ABP1FZH9_9CHLO
MFVLDAAGEVLETPRSRPAPYKPPKLSECSPLFMSAYELRGAGAVLHSHSLNAVMATLIDEDAKEFKVTHLEMIKGIAGHGYYGNCIVPIIENTARECELTGRLREAIQQYPESNAVLVRRHGVYVWGKDWIQAKTQAECYDYLFEAALRMKSLGINALLPQAPAPLHKGLTNGHATENGGHASKKVKLQHKGGKQPKAIVLDIEGTVAPISFVTETLFPYARARVTEHLTRSFDSEETQADLDLLRQQAQEDAAAGTSVVAIPDATASKDAIVDAAARNVFAQMDTDRKTTALKSLQGHIWREGFRSGSIKAELFRDVPDMLVQWRSMGIKSYIYSSGSREAQNNLFGHTTAGDLRPYLYGFFDTRVGPKVDAGSYKEISLSLGVDSGDEVTFATDILAEAVAAKEAGWNAILVSRPGNKPLPANAASDFRVIESLEDLLPFM